MNQRKQRANTMMELTGYATQIEHDKFKVRSQANPDNYYINSKCQPLQRKFSLVF